MLRCSNIQIMFTFNKLTGQHTYARDLRKHVFGVFDQVRHKLGCTASEDGKRHMQKQVFHDAAHFVLITVHPTIILNFLKLMRISVLVSLR